MYFYQTTTNEFKENKYFFAPKRMMRASVQNHADYFLIIRECLKLYVIKYM